MARNSARNLTVHGASKWWHAAWLSSCSSPSDSFEAGEDARDRQRKATSAGLASRFVLGPIRVSDSQFACLISNRPIPNPNGSRALVRRASAPLRVPLGVPLPLASRPALRCVSCGLLASDTNGRTCHAPASLLFCVRNGRPRVLRRQWGVAG